MTTIGFRREWDDDLHITLRTIDFSNLDAVVRMQIKYPHTLYVKSNAVSLAEAYVAQQQGKRILPFAIYAEQTLVGLVRIGYGRIRPKEPPVSDGNYHLWPFMLDEKWLDRGFERVVLELVLAYLHTEPLGPAQQVWTSIFPLSDEGTKLYMTLGFKRNGEYYGDDVVASRYLHAPADTRRVLEIEETSP